MTDGPKTFLQRIAERNGGATTGPQAPPTVVDVSVTGDGSPYGLKALREEASLVASATDGTRNHTLNRAAFKLAKGLTLETAGQRFGKHLIEQRVEVDDLLLPIDDQVGVDNHAAIFLELIERAHVTVRLG